MKVFYTNFQNNFSKIFKIFFQIFEISYQKFQRKAKDVWRPEWVDKIQNKPIKDPYMQNFMSWGLTD